MQGYYPLSYVREVTETDLFNCMCLYFQFDSICVLSDLLELVSLSSKQFLSNFMLIRHIFLLLHVFSLRVTLTWVRVTQFTHSYIYLNVYEFVYKMVYFVTCCLHLDYPVSCLVQLCVFYQPCGTKDNLVLPCGTLCSLV